MASTLRTVYTNFASGELNPLLVTRTDANAYFSGAKTLRNWYLLDEGGIMRRPGTTYKATLPGESRVIPFIFSNDELAVFVLSNNRLDVYGSDGAAIQTNITSNCNWTTAQLFELNFAQFGDTVFLTHRNNAIREIKRTSATSFTVSAFAFEEDTSVSVGGVNKSTQPFYKYAAAGLTITLSSHATGTGRTATASADFFTTNHVNTYLKINGKQVFITARTNATEATVTVIEDVVSTGPHADFEEQLISAERGFPQAVTFHDNRLYFAGVRDAPAAVVGSRVGEYLNFAVGTGLADQAINVFVSGDRVNEIRHLVSSRNLQVLTDGGEYFVPTSTDTSAVTPANITFLRQTPYGCSRAKPIIFDGATLYAQKNGKAIREYLFSDVENAYASTSISILASHLIKAPVDMAMITGTTTRPEQFAFFTNNDGTLGLFHSVRAEKIAGWTQWSTKTNDEFTSITAINENLFCVVKRQLEGGTVYTLEKFAEQDDLTLDCSGTTTVNQQGSPLINGASQTGTSVNVDGYTTAPNTGDVITIAGITGSYEIQTVTATASGHTIVLDQALASSPGDNAVITITSGRVHNSPAHLTQETVNAVDGTFSLGSFVTSASDTITFDVAHNAGVVVGFNYEPSLETMPIDREVANGPLTGQIKRISRAVIDLSDSLNVALQAADSTAKSLVIRDVNFDVAAPVAKVTGKKEFFFLGYDREPTLKITQTAPLPLKVLGVALEVVF
ncbi:putative tail tubular protein B [uncultured Mediterranean phage uvMED]|nr:putative tail tubular protein B [uncultured Mediterranean phage uvMED]BAQ86747.1 putative tail tubular protein B [uncultured Mediterranean phage uvMED]